MKREDLYGLEFDWFAVDKDNHIAHFSTAGYGAVPLQIIENIDEQDKLLDYFMGRSGSLSARLMVHQKGKFDDWLELAKCGLFSYDFKHWDGPYILIARSEEPITIESVPSSIRNSLNQVRFEDTATVSLGDFLFHI